MKNPFELISVEIYGTVAYARPVEFTASIADFNKCTDVFGRPVEVAKVLLTCPACGSPIEYNLKGPCTCCRCEASRPKKIKPFRDPILSGKVKLHQLIEHSYDPEKGFNVDINQERRKAIFSDFVEYGRDNTIPKSDLGLDDMVEE